MDYETYDVAFWDYYGAVFEDNSVIGGAYDGRGFACPVCAELYELKRSDEYQSITGPFRRTALNQSWTY